MDRKAVSMWKVTKNLILTDVCVIALFWLIPSVKNALRCCLVYCAPSDICCGWDGAS